MAHIEERKLTSGKTSFKAQVVMRIDGKRKKTSATFDRKADAVSWSKKVERQIDKQSIKSVFTRSTEPKTVNDAIDRYINGHKSELKSTKAQVLGFVCDGRCEFSNIKLNNLTSQSVRSFAEELSNNGCGPATVSSYLTHVCYVLANAEDDFGEAFHVSLDALERGKNSARRAGLAGRSGTRDRRPTMDELDLLMKFFHRRDLNDSRCVPMHLIVPFAIFGCRRQSEITGLLKADLENDELLVRGTKHPRKPQGADLETIVTPEALRVLQVQGRRTNAERFFPYNSGTVSRLFTEACKVLQIGDLHFHDLRHEGISWLLEKGWSTSHAMMVSGHSSTQTLDRYSKLKERGDKYEDWSWWPILEGNA